MVMMVVFLMVMVMVFYDGDDSAVYEGPDAKYFHLQPISGRHRRGERGSNWGVSRLALSSVVQWLTCWIFYFFFLFVGFVALGSQQQQQQLGSCTAKTAATKTKPIPPTTTANMFNKNKCALVQQQQ